MVLAAVALAGCNLGINQPQGVQPTTTPVNGVVPGAALSSPRALAWNPNAKELAWYMAGASLPLSTGLSERSIVLNCGSTRDGDIIYVGGDTAQPILYPHSGGAPINLGDTIGLACSLPDLLQVRSDGQLMGVIQYEPDAIRQNFTAGTLRLLKLPEAQPLFLVDRATAFEMYDDGVLFLRFFEDANAQAKSGDLRWWDGNTDRILEENIEAIEGCQMVAARVTKSGNTVYSLLGERCAGKGSTWRLVETRFDTDKTLGNSKNVANLATGGRYFTNAGSLNVWPLPDGEQVLITYPNGVAADLVDLVRVHRSTGDVQSVMENLAVDQYPPSVPRRLLLNAPGDRLAFVTRDPDGGETLYLYNLKEPQTEPVKVAGGNRSERITGVVWTADGQRLFYAITGDLNGVSYFSLSGEDKLVARGVFQNIAIDPDGKYVVVSEQTRSDANDVRNNLTAIEVGTGNRTVLVQGDKGQAALRPLIAR